MCERLGQLREALGRYAASFDSSLLSSEQAAGAVAEPAAIEKTAATVKGLAAAQRLARSTGTLVRQAGETIATARRLEKLPAAAAAGMLPSPSVESRLAGDDHGCR